MGLPSSLPASGDAPATLKRPLCVFAVGDAGIEPALAGKFDDLGIQVVFVRNMVELLSVQSLPECFAAFVDIQVHPRAFALFRARPEQDRSYWIFMGLRLSKYRNTVYLNHGVVDLITLPVHPMVLKGRALQLLAKFLRAFKMPEDVVLPLGSDDLRVADTHKKPDSKVGMADGNFGNHRSEPKRLEYLLQVEKKVLREAAKFQSIGDPEVQKSYFKEVSELKNEAMLWTRGQQWKVRCNVTNFDTDSGVVEFSYPAGQNRESFRAGLATVNPSNLFICFNLSRARLFCVQSITKMKFLDSGISFVLPGPIFEVQRRQHFRLKFPEENSAAIFVTLNKSAPRQYRMVDLSAGGALLGMSETDGERFRTGQALASVEFSIFGRKVTCSGRVQWKRKNTQDPSLPVKMGISFYHINYSDQEGINLFVMEGIYDYLKKFVDPND